MSRGSQSHCRPKLCLSLVGQLVLPGWLQLFAGRQALPAKILAHLGTNTCLCRPNRYPGLWPMGFPDSQGPGNPNCSAHCASPGNGSSRHSVMDLCGTMAPNEKVIISVIYHHRSHFYHSFRRQERSQEGTPETGIHQDVCPFCQCGHFNPRSEAPVNNDDNRSVWCCSLSHCYFCIVAVQ